MNLHRLALALLVMLHSVCWGVRSAVASATLSVVPISLEFNSQTVRTQSAGQTVTVTNIGDATLALDSFNISPQFIVRSGPGLPLHLSPGSGATFTVVFAPDTAGSSTGQLSFSTDAPIAPPPVALSGTGSFSLTLVNVTPHSIAYGNQSSGVVTCSQTVTVSNGGSTSFTVTQAAALSPFMVTSFPGVTQLRPGQQISFGVAFNPATEGNFNGNLIISINDQQPAIVPISGTGVQASGPSAVPLIDMGQQQNYLGFDGGLFDGGCNSAPADHDAVGRSRAALVTPLDMSGNPSPKGRIVLLSIGMCNASLEFCGQAFGPPEWGCPSPQNNAFIEQASGNPAVNHQTLVILNGAEGGQEAVDWTDPAKPDYDSVKTSVLEPAGVTEAQVQAVWLKNADGDPTVSLPSASADAYTLETYLGDAVRAMKVRYPNLRVVFLSSRIYAGYATVPLNPEPYAYESGYAVKWLVRAQINQARTGRIVDPHAGDLNYNTVAPWIVWGPYLWADGPNPRSDGLVWLRQDLSGDGTHPSASGMEKVGSLLMNYFLNSPYTGWFLSSSARPHLSGAWPE